MFSLCMSCIHIYFNPVAYFIFDRAVFWSQAVNFSPNHYRNFSMHESHTHTLIGCWYTHVRNLTGMPAGALLFMLQKYSNNNK